MFINHNISAIKTNSQLSINNNNLSASIQRLSSGYRINKSADDPAGMAISRKMRTQIAALDQASSNASDGISVIQTAEGALTEVQSMLQRMRELSVQAANGTLTEDDKQAVQDEIDELSQEIDRISTDTEFNTKTLLNGTLDRVTYTNNANVSIFSTSDGVKSGNYEITVTTPPKQATVSGGGSTAFTGTGGVVAESEKGSITINGETIQINTGETRTEVINKLRDLCDRVNIKMETGSGSLDTVGASYKFTTEAYGADASILITGSNIDLLNKLGLGGISNVEQKGTDPEISPKVVTTGSGFTNTATVTYDDKYATVQDYNGFKMVFDLSKSKAGDKAELQIFDAGPMVLQVGANENQTLKVTIPEVSCKSLMIDDVNVMSSIGAQAAITKVDKAVNSVSAVRAQLGAYQNRLESSVANLDTTSENITESLSRIEDVDMADEMTKYTQYQVLVQASTSVLAQANERPQTVLSLLQS